MRIATWNINGIRARLETARAWVGRPAGRPVHAGDQVRDHAFPSEPFEELGYNVHSTARRGSTASRSCRSCRLRTSAPGLSATTRHPCALHRGGSFGCRRGTPRRLALFPERQPAGQRQIRLQARLDGAPGGVRVRGCAARGAVRSRRRLQRHPELSRRALSRNWRRDALFQPETRSPTAPAQPRPHRRVPRLQQRGGIYTFWDYQAGAWQKDNGILIDHMLLSPPAADRLSAAGSTRARAAGTSRPTTCRCGWSWRRRGQTLRV